MIKNDIRAKLWGMPGTGVRNEWHGNYKQTGTQVEDAFKESVKYRNNKLKKYLKQVIQILKVCTVRNIKAQYAQCTMRRSGDRLFYNIFAES